MHAKMSNRNIRPSACSSPLPTLEDFPPLHKEPQNFMQPAFKRFLMIKHADPETKMTNISPFEVDDSMKKFLGKKHTCKISENRSTGYLLIEVDREPLYDKLLSTRKIEDIPVVIEEHRQMNTSKGIIYCDSDAVKSMSNEEIQSAMEDQKVTEVYRITKRDGTKTNLFIITFGTPLLPKDVKVGYMKIEVRLYIPNPRRCFNCQRYGHGKNTCTHEIVCVTCGKSGHEYGSDDCDKEKKCYHCGQEHESSFRDCPMWKLEKFILEVKLKNNITFKEARSQVYQSKTQLVSQIPRIQAPKSQSTYRDVTAQPTVAAALHHQIQQQQQQISVLTRQISELLAVIGRQSSMPIPSTSNGITANDTLNMPELDRIQRHKRKQSSEDLSPPASKQKPASNGQEVSNMPDTSIPRPSGERESSHRQEDKNMPAPSPASDRRVSKGVREDSSVLSEGKESSVSTSTPVEDETASQGASPMEVPVLQDQSSSVDRRLKGGGKTSKALEIKGGENTTSPVKAGGSSGIISSYRQRFSNKITNKKSTPDSKLKK